MRDNIKSHKTVWFEIWDKLHISKVDGFLLAAFLYIPYSTNAIYFYTFFDSSKCIYCESYDSNQLISHKCCCLGKKGEWVWQEEGLTYWRQIVKTRNTHKKLRTYVRSINEAIRNKKEAKETMTMEINGKTHWIWLNRKGFAFVRGM